MEQKERFRFQATVDHFHEMAVIFVAHMFEHTD